MRLPARPKSRESFRHFPVVDNAEDVLAAKATHTCPVWGGRFDPRVCVLRKERQPARWPAGDSTEDEDLIARCRRCSGPVEIEHNRQEGKMTDAAECKPTPGTATCRKCGREYDETEFDRTTRPKDYCRACKQALRADRVQRMNQARLSARTMAAENEEAAVEVGKSPGVGSCSGIAAQNPEKEAAGHGRYTCPVHGTHNGDTVGGRHVSACPACTRAKRIRSIRAASRAKAPIAVHVPLWAREWLEEQAVTQGFKDAQTYVRRRILEDVPAELAKQMLLEDVR